MGRRGTRSRQRRATRDFRNLRHVDQPVKRRSEQLLLASSGGALARRSETTAAYENGWNAIINLFAKDYSWNGHEPNVLLVRKDGKYIDVSGLSGLDFAKRQRAFSIVDFDGDGRPTSS